VREGRFREDLYYRLNAATLSIPPLRERRDFDWLLDTVVARHRLDGEALAVSPAALLALRAHGWPGNIRELDNVIAVAAALCQDGVIEPGDLPETLTSAAGVAARIDDANAGPAALKAMLGTCGWNISETARRMGVDRSTIHRQIKRYGLTALN
jgi:transcriptional regulator of acetoin/glycerol metabolism